MMNISLDKNAEHRPIKEELRTKIFIHRFWGDSGREIDKIEEVKAVLLSDAEQTIDLIIENLIKKIEGLKKDKFYRTWNFALNTVLSELKQELKQL